MTFRRSVVLLAVGLLIALFGPVAQAAENGSATVGTQTEAWYVTTTSESCSTTALDCSLLPPPDYPKNTLHVGVSGGTPTAATYIELDLFSANIPLGAIFTKGTLTLPVDMAPSDGTLRQDMAKLRVCQVTDFFSAAEASPQKPPETDCKAASANATYSAKPAPTFHVDLKPFLAGWAQGDPAALAIMPAPKAVKDSETWHVAFFGKDYGAGQQEDVPVSMENGDPKSITAKLSYKSDEPDIPPPPPPPEIGIAPPLAPSPPPVSPIDTTLPEFGGDAPAPKVEPPPETAKPAPQPVAAPEFITVGYKYPIAWIMPLLLLIGFAMTGHSLTRSLERPGGSLA
ncbi:hypothetical protein [Haloechinothrix halophila]|uniref:hypothetical protein n=1 Tax=Haloechinothrix halophila TaxID=1069073 RepID=UPI0004031CF4|nr:hypothetical protein [Haloechinothrix halophila]